MNRHVLSSLAMLLLVAGHALAAPPGQVVRCAFDGDLLDATGLGNDVRADRPAFEPGHQGQALRVAGRAPTIGDAAELRLAPDLRLETWIRFDGPPAGRSILTKDREYMLRVDPGGEGGQFAFFVHLNEWEPRVRSTVVPRPGEWYHVVAAWDGEVIALEVNGQVARQERRGRPVAAGEPLEIGPFDGLIDELSIANPGAGQVGEASWTFDDSLRDGTGRGHDLIGAARFGDGRRGRAAHLTPALSAADSADLRLAPGLRIDCTVRFEEVPTGYGYLVVKDGEYMLRVDSQAEGSRFSFFVNLGGWEPRVQSDIRAEPGVWYRLSARWDGQALTLEVNGLRSRTVRSGLATPGDKPLVLGPVAGYLDDLRIENPRLPMLRLRALTQERTLLLAGREELLTGLVENLGSPADGVTATLSVGRGATCLTPPTLELGALPTGASAPVAWTVRADESLSTTLAVQLVAGDHRPAPYHRWLAFYGATGEPRPPEPAGLEQPAATWYIDPLAGDNARAGTSPQAAWRDFANLEGKVLGPGERLLIRRGSVIDQELRITARATPERWAEIGAYGEGARPVLRRNWDIDERCALVRDPDYLRIAGLTFCYAGKGLVVQYSGIDHAGLVIEDCLAHHIEGLYRVNAHGIPEWRDRLGAEGDSLHSSAGIAVIGPLPRDVLVRDCEMFQCSWGFFVQGDNVTVDRVFCHDNNVHNTSPHPAMVAVKRSFLTNSLLDSPGWHASAGTMGIMLVDHQGLVIRNCTFRNQPDSGSHDEGGIDFENTGNGCLIDGCTFENNAGAAIEVLGLQTPQPRNLEITGSRFIQNNVANKLGPAEIFVWGRTNSADVCCSTGLIRNNGYVLRPGVEFYLNEAPETTSWELADNTAYPDAAALRRAMPLNDPPTAEAGPSLYPDGPAVRLAGRVSDTSGRAPAARWEVVEGPGPVTFEPSDSAETTARVPEPGDYLLRLVADDGELWHSDLVAVHRLPAGATTIAAWEFDRPRDKEGWTEADLGTQVREFANQDWPTRSEPVRYAAGGFYVVAVEESASAHLLSPDGLGIKAAAAPRLRLRMMNHTPARRMRLRFVTEADRAWDDAKSLTFEVTPNDPAPRVYELDLAGVPGWTGNLQQIRLDLATGAPLTGTVRIDYVWLGGP